MKEFTYKIKDELGLHARPAGLLVKKAGEFESHMLLYKEEKSADLKRLFALMGLSVKKDDTVIVKISGADEAEAAAALESFFKDNF